MDDSSQQTAPQPAAREDRSRPPAAAAGLEIASESSGGQAGAHLGLVEDPAYSTEAGARGALCLVADSGRVELDGEPPAQIAASALRAAYYDGGRAEPAAALLEAIRFANHQLLEQAAGRPEAGPTVTALTAAVIRDGALLLAHLGDGRAYLVRQRAIAQLTTDHTLPLEGVDSGEAPGLSRALGEGEAVAPELGQHQLQPGDVLVLGPSGLHRAVSEQEIGRICSELAPARAARELTRLATERGDPRDGCSVVVARYGQPPVGWLRRYWLPLLGGVAALALLGGVAAYSLSQSQPGPTAAPTATAAPAIAAASPVAPPVPPKPAPSPTTMRQPGRIEGPDGSANMRVAARLDAQVRAELPNGTQVVVLNMVDGDEFAGVKRWYEVEVVSSQAPGQRGFVHSPLVSLDGAARPSPSPSPTTP
jgi:protein phosphatase